MRVAHVNQDPGVGPGRSKGAAVHVTALRDAFAREGAEVVAVDEPDDGALAERLETPLAAGAIDLVYERYALGAHCAGDLARRHGVPHVLEVNAPLILEAERYRGLAPTAADHDLERSTFRGATRVLCVSRALCDYVAERRGDRSGVVLEPNAVDPAFRAGPEPRAGFCTPGRIVLGFHGRLRPWHGFERQVQLAARLMEAGVDLELALVGEGDFAAAEELPEDRVVRVPWCAPAEVPMHVARFDLVALTYGPDAPTWFSPLKLAEAMAVGAVPLVADHGDLVHEVRDGVSGRVLPGAAPRAWLDAALELCHDRPLRARLSDGARRAVADRTWDAVARRVLGLVAEPARGSRR